MGDGASSSNDFEKADVTDLLRVGDELL